MSAATDCYAAGCRWGAPGGDSCECIAILTEADVTMLERVMAAGVNYTDFDESAYFDESPA